MTASLLLVTSTMNFCIGFNVAAANSATHSDRGVAVGVLLAGIQR
jgi:hypothetical protein